MTIQEVSNELDISKDTLRYYERIGLVGPITKNKSGIRVYKEDEVNRLNFIKCMRNAQVPIEVLKEYLSLYDKGEETKEERRKLLEEQKVLIEDKIKNLEDARERLIKKLELLKDDKLDKCLEK